jgi:hypothetical protein
VYQEAKRELKVIGGMFKKDPLSPMRAYFSRYVLGGFGVSTIDSERILLEHAANYLQLPLGLLIGLIDCPTTTLGTGQIGPVYTIDVRVLRAQVIPQRVFGVNALSIVEHFRGMRGVQLVVGIRREFI